MWGVNVTEGDVGGLHFFDVTEHQTGKTVENKGENSADLRLHQGMAVTEGQIRICAVNVTDGREFCGGIVTKGGTGICILNVTEGQREKE